MPNWKSYESSVRLLSAIIAAHPGMKLNYDGMSDISWPIVRHCLAPSIASFPLVNFILLAKTYVEIPDNAA